MKPFGIVIPARYASSRLPGKPLLELAGKPMIQWVVENAKKVGAEFVWVATDDERIAEVVRAFGGEAVMTQADHATGSDRLAEVVAQRDLAPETVIVNVQGDEPMLAAKFIEMVATALIDHPEASIATLANPILEATEVFDPNVVKVVLRNDGMAHYFSRAPIPWHRLAFAHGVPSELPADVPFLRHVGLYAYRAASLKRLSQLPQASVEGAESLEQLRALHAGFGIHVSVVDEAPAHGVDTPEDLKRVGDMLRNLISE